MRLATGFTIIELMITVVVLGIALAFAVPNMQTFIMNNRMTSNLNQLSSNLALARNEAIKQNMPVVVCPTGGGEACAEAGWEDGWLAYVDRDRDLAYDSPAPDCTDSSLAEGQDCLLLLQSRLEPPTTLSPASGIPALIGYDGSGAAFCDANEDGAPEPCATNNTFFTICDPRGADYARALAVSRTGRVSILQATPNGSALSCPGEVSESEESEP
jgi:type IV fimbrial biogenesis protein FimT